jgi:lysine-specific demethylase 8
MTLQSTPMCEENCHDKQSLVETIRPHVESQTPVVLREAVARAPAMQLWKSWDYLETAVDTKTPCHVEVGGNYAHSQRCDIRFGDYLAYLRFFQEKYGRSGDETPHCEDLIYLAQNDAFEGLYQDFNIPDFCTTLGEGKLYSTMIWMGPYGCVSPLHYDPMDNVLMQFVGTKRVIMYPPEAYIYPGVDGYQSNTSPLDPEGPLDLEKYPLAAELPPPFECTLAAGDLLYIPSKWWHFIRTIETSISINCWWR